MKTLEKLQETYEKELNLAKKHKKKADELKQKIDEHKALTLQRKMQELNLSVDEYEKFLVFVSDKDFVRSVISPEEVENAIGRAAMPESIAQEQLNEEKEMKKFEES